MPHEYENVLFQQAAKPSTTHPPTERKEERKKAALRMLQVPTLEPLAFAHVRNGGDTVSVREGAEVRKAPDEGGRERGEGRGVQHGARHVAEEPDEERGALGEGGVAVEEFEGVLADDAEEKVQHGGRE